MSDNPQTLKFKQVVHAPLPEIYDAFTSATAFTEWLCDVAQADAHVGGRLYLYWQAGYYASGEFVELEPERSVVFSWHGRGEPGLTRVKVSLEPQEQGVRVALSHSGLGSGKAWKAAHKQIKKGWARGLENLKSVLESGMDLRFLRRPLLGVVGLEEIDAEQAAGLGMPPKGGVRLTGIVEGMSAQQAGLQAGDVMVKFNGQRVDSISALVNQLRELRAGDQVKVIFYRDGRKDSLKMQLSERPLPEIPPSAEALGQAVEDMYVGLNANLGACLEGISDEQASFRPDPQSWNVKQVLAHLIASEREVHAWAASMIEDQEAGFSFHANQPTRLAATVSAFPRVQDLMAELRRNQSETVAMLAGLPEGFVTRKRTYWRLGLNLLSTPYHYHDHCAQIQALVANAGEHGEVEQASERKGESL